MEPWIEKYRPSELKDVILSAENKIMINTMIKRDYYPNMIFYGPPGTGKTTTILCLLKKYQEIHKCDSNFLHLNASHQRGVDVIRNQIKTFVKNKNFFHDHKKFVLLDEVDSMTKQAQNYLYRVIIKSNENVCFILICNYFNKIIEPIRNNLVIMSFKQTSEHSDKFLKKCIKSENVKISKAKIELLKQRHSHDLRSVLNCIQNYDIDNYVLTKSHFKDLLSCNDVKKKLEKMNKYIHLFDIFIGFFQYLFVLNKEIESFIDFKILEMSKFLLFHNQCSIYFIETCIPYIKSRINQDSLL